MVTGSQAWGERGRRRAALRCPPNGVLPLRCAPWEEHLTTHGGGWEGHLHLFHSLGKLSKHFHPAINKGRLLGGPPSHSGDILVSFPVAMIRYSGKSNFTEKGLMLDHSLCQQGSQRGMSLEQLTHHIHSQEASSE